MNYMFLKMLRTLLFTLAATGALAANCTRETLRAATDSLIAAQQAGNAALLAPVADGVAYTENQRSASLATGILSQALLIDHNRSSLDTTQCATYTELISATGPKPYVVGVQMYWSGPSIAKIDTIITSTGDWLFNATSTLRWASGEAWDTIPSDRRSSRAVIQAAADAYCDIFYDASVVVPWGYPCVRLEGGMYTGNGSPEDTCDVGIPEGVSLTNRKYVIDETVGAVDVMLSFQGVPDSHEFRIEDGKIRFVHTMTVMTARQQE